MRIRGFLVAALLVCASSGALAFQASPKDKAGQELSAAVGEMLSDESGDARLAAYGMAYEWSGPATEGRTGAIFSQMKVNHVFGRRLTTGDFREDVLVGFDSKANMRFAVLHGGIGDSCPALAAKKFSLKIASRAGKITVDGGEPRPFESGKEKGCFVQIVANSFDLRDLLNQSAGLPLYFTLTVDGADRPIFYKSAGLTKAFWQSAEVMIARQNLALVNN